MHAAAFFANAVNSLVEGLVPIPSVARAVDFVAEIYMVGYFVLAFRRAYETTFLSALWRTASIALLYFVALLGALVAIAAPTLLPLFSGQAP